MATKYVKVQVPGGGEYKGSWLGGEDGAPHGWGVSRDPEGNVYTGTFEKGVPQGKGSHQHVTGERYDGMFKMGKKHGVGVWSHTAGDKYYGQYSDDLRHGFGVYINPGGQKFEGEWHMDKPKRRCPLPEDIKRFIAETEVYGELPDKTEATYGEISDQGRGQPTRTPSGRSIAPSSDNSSSKQNNNKNNQKKKKIVAQTGPVQIYGETPYGDLVYDRASATSSEEIYDTVRTQDHSSFKIKGGPPPPPPDRSGKPPPPPSSKTNSLVPGSTSDVPDSYFEVATVEDSNLASEVDGMYLDVDLRRVKKPGSDGTYYLGRTEASAIYDRATAGGGGGGGGGASGAAKKVVDDDDTYAETPRNDKPVYDRASGPQTTVAAATTPVYDTASVSLESAYGQVLGRTDVRASTNSTLSSGSSGSGPSAMQRIGEPPLRPSVSYAQPLTIPPGYDSPNPGKVDASSPQSTLLQQQQSKATPTRR